MPLTSAHLEERFGVHNVALFRWRERGWIRGEAHHHSGLRARYDSPGFRVWWEPWVCRMVAMLCLPWTAAPTNPPYREVWSDLMRDTAGALAAHPRAWHLVCTEDGLVPTESDAEAVALLLAQPGPFRRIVSPPEC